MICQEVVDRNRPWGFFKEKKAFGHFECGGIEIYLCTAKGRIPIGREEFTWALFREEHVENDALRYCEFRVTSNANEPEDMGNYRAGDHLICEAGGNFSLGIVGKNTEKIVEICHSCNIPESMSKGTTPCLHLIPFRVYNEDKGQTYYTCQWFFSFSPKSVHMKRESQCEGNCLFWFPRPKNKPRLFDPKCEKFLRMFLEPKRSNS